ncbi:hypothetical protein [Chitinophaga alhagiae]|uniref:hypothetical protein n=1 Tax=Chitinophaga alhagiae TaxID=2203219 RepID=UPI0013001B3A|nr:hypothetical protein [Chitinophaga alhagiae]
MCGQQASRYARMSADRMHPALHKQNFLERVMRGQQASRYARMSADRMHPALHKQ